MHYRYLALLTRGLISSLLLAAALYSEVDVNETSLLALKADPLILKALMADGVVEERGNDDDLRVRCEESRVAFETFFTDALISGALKRVIAVIHTGEATPDVNTLLQAKGTVLVAYPALNKYPENPSDVPLGCLEIAKEMAGTTYLFQTAAEEWRTFSIRFTQAMAPTHSTHAAMWLGDVESGPAAERLAQVSAYLQACQGPDLFSFISN